MGRGGRGGRGGLPAVPAGVTGGSGALEVLVLRRSSSQRTQRPPHWPDCSLSHADLYSPPLKLLYKPAERRARERAEQETYERRGEA